MNRGILVVLSGFSGSGKGTVVKELMSRYSDQYALSISATTRPPRMGETDGVEYFFKSHEEFMEMIDHEQLIEYAQYVNHYYGTPKEYVVEQLEAGKDVILEIEVQGAMKVMETMDHTVSIFLAPPSIKELENRLVSRGTEDLDTVHRRLARAAEEVSEIDQYDYLVVNDQLEECVERLHQTICSEHQKTFRNEKRIQFMKEELVQFRKEMEE